MIGEITIQPGTLETSPVSVTFELPVSQNIVKEIIVNIPDGHKYLARLKIETQGRRLAPDLNSSAWVRGNNSQVVFPINLRLEGPPYKINLIGWNEDDTYQHTFFVEVR